MVFVPAVLFAALGAALACTVDREDEERHTSVVATATQAPTRTAATASPESAALGGSEALLFVVPLGAHNAIAVEAWQVVDQWDLQTVDGTVNAVRHWAIEGDPEHTQTLARLKTRITTAAATDDFAGDRIANASGLTATTGRWAPTGTSTRTTGLRRRSRPRRVTQVSSAMPGAPEPSAATVCACPRNADSARDRPLTPARTGS